MLREVWDTTRLRLLVELERQGSLSAAARAIGIGQPSASAHLRVLESAAGQRLAERHGRGLKLTQAGHALAVRAGQALASLQAADEELAALSGLQTGTIHVGSSTAPGVYLLPDTLGCFRRECPGVRVEIEIASSSEILGRLLSGSLQLAIVGADEADPRIVLEPFLDDEIVGVAKPGTLPVEDGVVTAAALAGQTLLAREPGSSSRRAAEPEVRRIAWGTVWELGSSEAIKRSTRAGLGVAFLSRYAVAEEVGRGELELFRLAGRPPITRHFSVARLGGRPPSPAEQRFVATLTRCCASNAAYADACVGVIPRRSPRAAARRRSG